MGLDMGIYREDTDSEIAYWRKHPNLHGFIVNTFADGIDECQKIPLTLENLEKIISAVAADSLPDTEGCFFGASFPEYRESTLEQLHEVRKLVESGFSVYYQASW
jgi:hypothetical protein